MHYEQIVVAFDMQKLLFGDRYSVGLRVLYVPETLIKVADCHNSCKELFTKLSYIPYVSIL